MKQKRMKTIRSSVSIIITIALLIVTLCSSAGAPVMAADGTSIGNLMVNYQTSPYGVDPNEAIRFSWNMESGTRGQGQKSYQIKVYEGVAEGEPVWDSTEIEESGSVGIPYAGNHLEMETRYAWTVEVTTTIGNEVITAESWFETGTAIAEDGRTFDGAEWIMPAGQEDGAPDSTPMLRTEKELAGEVASARLYISALGIYTAYINGQEVTDKGDIFNPGWTDYKYRVNYQTYDVTGYISDNTIALGVMLGKGWYAGVIGRGAYTRPGQYGIGNYESIIGVNEPDVRELAFIAKMVITYADGSSETINTDDAWKSTVNSPVLSNDFFHGETYDANIAKEVAGWNDTGYDDSEWDSVTPGTLQTQTRLSPSSKATARIVTEYNRQPIGAYTYNDSETIPSPQSVYPFGEIVKHEKNVEGTIDLQAGDTLIVDMGQNMVGVAKIQVSGDQNTTVTMRHAEMLNDGKGDPDQVRDPRNGWYGSDGPKDTVYMESINNADVTDRYILSGDGIETYQPTYTYHGFRYLEITTDSDITLHDIEGMVITAVGQRTGFLETSDSDVNQLVSNALWSQMGNYLSIPTDCPQRGERAGWTADAQLFAQTGLYNYDVYSFSENYIEIMNDIAANEGDKYSCIMPATVHPSYAGRLASGWSDAGIVMPWILYQQTGDTTLIKEYYDQMDAYMDYVIENGYDDTFYGDWLAFSGASTPYMNAVYQIYTTQLMSKMADIIGISDKKIKYDGRYNSLRAKFLEKYVDPEGNLLSSTADGVTVSNHQYPVIDNSQTGLLWALKCGLYRDDTERNIMIANLIANIKNKDGLIREGYDENTLSVGFLGVNVILPVLTEIGAADVAYNLLLQDTMPSWLYSVKNGATTIWERWNSYSAEDGFGPSSMNSFNHYSYGACLEWMYEYMGGITMDEDDPGFQKIILQPTVDESGRITYVNSSYNSVYGDIVSNWKAEDGYMTQYDITIPANTSATLYLPMSEANAKLLAKLTEGITFEVMAVNNGLDVAKFNVESGTYELDEEIFALQKTANDAQKALEAAQKEAAEKDAEAIIAKQAADAAKIKADAAEKAAKQAQDDASKSAAEAARLKAEVEKAQAEAAKLKAEAEKAQAEAKKAQAELEKAKKNVGLLAPQKGTTATVSNLKYRVTKSDLSNGTVTVTGPTKKTLTKITIPATVKISGVTFKVTAISEKAFANNKKLNTLTIDKNVKTIGKQAFDGDAKLKKITINSSSITKIGKNAFRGIDKKATIKVPSKKLTSYRKMLRDAGVKSTATIKK